jgi:2-methylcitrate dehydratase PrpD
MLIHGGRVSASGAALANAALFHGRGQEDTCGAGHFGAILIPLLTALFEERKLPMQRFIPALVAGYEIGGLLEREYSSVTTPKGLRSSPLYGTIAAAAASARALDLPAERIGAAISNAASFTGGLLQSFEDGTDEWRYQVGIAARNGLVATELAAAGSVSAPHAIDGGAGFAKAFAGVKADIDRLAASLGRDWSIHRVTFKPFPVCAFNQTPVTAALELREKLAGRSIQHITVRMNPYEAGYAGMDSKGPFSTISGTLMSIPFCIALTVLRGEPNMASMRTYDDPLVNDLIDNIDLIADADVARLCCVIEAQTQSGDVVKIEKNVTTDDYNFDRDTVSAMIRRIGGEQGIPAEAFSRLETYVSRMPGVDITEIIDIFALCPMPAEFRGRPAPAGERGVAVQANAVSAKAAMA